MEESHDNSDPVSQVAQPFPRGRPVEENDTRCLREDFRGKGLMEERGQRRRGIGKERKRQACKDVWQSCQSAHARSPAVGSSTIILLVEDVNVSVAQGQRTPDGGQQAACLALMACGGRVLAPADKASCAAQPIDKRAAAACPAA
jgi:hypothetical protein